MSSETLDSHDYDSDGDDEACLISEQGANVDSTISIPDLSPLLVELAPDDFPLYFCEHGGRLFHSHRSSPYPLPVDTPEQQVNYIYPSLYHLRRSIELMTSSPAIERYTWCTQPTDWRELFGTSFQYSGAGTWTSETRLGLMYRHGEMV